MRKKKVGEQNTSEDENRSEVNWTNLGRTDADDEYAVVTGRKVISSNAKTPATPKMAARFRFS